MRGLPEERELNIEGPAGEGNVVERFPREMKRLLWFSRGKLTG